MGQAMDLVELAAFGSCRAWPGEVLVRPEHDPMLASCRPDPYNFVSCRAPVGPKTSCFVPARLTRPAWPDMEPTKDKFSSVG
jgi:hypothetical protein